MSDGMTKVNENERSWAISMISSINAYVRGKGLVIKKADGEKTINTGSVRMFPDIILYGDEATDKLLQGWEVKMPDVPIADKEFHKDAIRKAKNLRLNSFVKWNFSYVEIHVAKAGTKTEYEVRKRWDLSKYIKKRSDVKTHEEKWQQVLQEVIDEINAMIQGREVRPASLGEVVSDSVMALIINENKTMLSEYLQGEALKDATMRSELSYWWEEAKENYMTDEQTVYTAYAKMLLLDWMNKILFANMLKGFHNDAARVEEITEKTTPEEAQEIFEEITKTCDFYSIFSPELYGERIPLLVWEVVVSFNSFLKDRTIVGLDSRALQNVLERTVATSKREVVGQYTTPENLAKLLVKLTVDDMTGEVIDPCCGTGTIPKMAMEEMSEYIDYARLTTNTWAMDKMKFPLQIANLNMTHPETINIPNRVVQQSVFDLNIGDTVEIVNPTDGSVMVVEVPSFATIVSNLPFVGSNTDRSGEDIHIADLHRAIEEITGVSISKRLDIYGYIIVKLKELLKEKGRLGVITSNSWFATEVGTQFFEILPWFFNIKGVFAEGPTRWFKNAKVRGSVLILENKEIGEPSGEEELCIGVVKQPIEEMEETEMDEIARIFNTGRLADNDLVYMQKYQLTDIKGYRAKNISLNAIFYNIDWFKEVEESLVPINSKYTVYRGERTGQDNIFYISKKDAKAEGGIGNIIDMEFIVEGRKTTRGEIAKLVMLPDTYVVVCDKTLKELEDGGYTKTYEWFKRFEGALNKSVAAKGEEWNQLKTPKKAVLCTGMNPGERLYVSKCEKPMMLNQRLIGLQPINIGEDIDLHHALLNSLIGLFYIEGIGYSRGEGALDFSKDAYAKGWMLDPEGLSVEDRNRIIVAFEKVKKKTLNTMQMVEILDTQERERFDRAVLRAYGLEEYYEAIKYSLVTMLKTRVSARIPRKSIASRFM